MKHISLNNYLDASNNWTLRLLGDAKFNKVRDINQVENEYNLDKYAKLLSVDLKTIEEYKVKEFEYSGLRQDDEIFFSLKDELFKAKLSIVRKIYYQIIKDKIEKYKSENICECGCGYGYNLSYLSGQVYGGEYSANAVALAKKLGKDVCQFNYYNFEDYSFIRNNSTICTIHSLEQIPDAACFLKGMELHKSKINFVVNIEPSVVDERTTLLGLLRNKYLKINDYNSNLIKILRANIDIEILECEYDVIGINPLNSANIIVWRFKK